MMLPKNIVGSTKYSEEQGLFTIDSFKDIHVNKQLKAVLVRAANSSLTIDTWSSYKTSWNQIILCGKELDCNMDFPISNKSLLTFIAWCAGRDLACGTIELYLSGIKKVHIVLGLTCPDLRPDLVKTIIKGLKNQEFRFKKSKRLPMTPGTMFLLKHQLSRSNMETTDALMFWSACTAAFFGSLRLNEILCKKSSSYDSAFTLLRQDMTVVEDEEDCSPVLNIELKHSKCYAGKSEIISIRKTGDGLCPVKAFNKYRSKTRNLSPALPAFCGKSGKPLTKRVFQRLLRSLLEPVLGPLALKLSNHSFRAGIPSILANKGYSEADIKAVGRWSSRAWTAYAALPRKTRYKVSKKIGKALKRRSA